MGFLQQGAEYIADVSDVIGLNYIYQGEDLGLHERGAKRSMDHSS